MVDPCYSFDNMNSELANENEGVLETLKQSNSKKVAL